MKKEINPVLKRLSDWAESKGGFAEVGRRIQKHPSMFYNLIRRDALPSLATLTEIAKEFPDLDLNYIIRGLQSVQQKELNELKEQLQIKEATIVKLVMPAEMVKSRGAALLCPGVRTRNSRKIQVQEMDFRLKRNPLPGRVPGTIIPNIMNDVYDILR